MSDSSDTRLSSSLDSLKIAKAGETEQKRVVSKRGNDLLEIVPLQKCCYSDKRLIFLRSLNVKNSKKTILKDYFIQTKDINYSSFLLSSTECFLILFAERKTNFLYKLCETL